MSTMTAPYPPSPAQISFIESLLLERELTDEQVSTTRQRIAEGTLSRKGASATIDKLLALPSKPKAATLMPGSDYAELVKVLETVPKSKYAIPAAELETLVEKTTVHGDLLFVEVKEYKNRLYIRKLTGNVGGFTRSKIEAGDAIALAKYIAADPYRFTKLFGAHYSCCGKCGAELTDPVSRELFLGPTCRKSFGFA